MSPAQGARIVLLSETPRELSSVPPALASDSPRTRAGPYRPLSGLIRAPALGSGSWPVGGLGPV